MHTEPTAILSSGGTAIQMPMVSQSHNEAGRGDWVANGNVGLPPAQIRDFRVPTRESRPKERASVFRKDRAFHEDYRAREAKRRVQLARHCRRQSSAGTPVRPGQRFSAPSASMQAGSRS